MRKLFLSIAALAAVLAGGYTMGLNAAEKGRVYELRTYTSHEGKLNDVVARFRNHTTKIFEKHGMKNHGYWIPQDEPKKSNTLIYVISHESREAAKKSWDAFRNDEEWKKVRAASEANGPIVAKVESVFMDAVDFSGMK